MEKSFLANLEWRFATKQFDTSKPVSDTDIATIRHAIRMAPASSGLQAYVIYEIADPAVRAKLREASYGQAQVTDASHFFIFCGRSDLADRAELMMNTMSGGNPTAREALAPLENIVRGTISNFPTPEAAFAWTGRQAYIALGFGLAACAELGIDACPMEGFEPKKFDKILGLAKLGLESRVLVTLGFRSKEDKTAAYKKVRYPRSEVVLEI